MATWFHTFAPQTTVNGLESGDLKPINKSAKYLYDCGHIQDMEFGFSSAPLHLRATYIPEMRKDRIFKVIMTLDYKTYNITTATCGCPAGKGTTCRYFVLCSCGVCTSGKSLIS